MSDAQIRAFLLGRVPPSEAETLEIRAIGDDELFQAIREAEYDLFDEYVAGRLNAVDRRDFEARFGAQTDRVAIAQALARLRAGTDRPASKRPAWTVALPLAAAAGLVLAAGGAWLLWGRSPVSQQAPIAQSARLAPAPAPIVALVTLDASRAAAEPMTIAMTASAPALRLRVRLNPLDRFDSYAMTLRSSDPRREWKALGLKPSVENGDLIVQADVPASAIPNGAYELAVRGGTEDLGFVTINITRQ